MSRDINVREPIVEVREGVRVIRCPYPNCSVIVKKKYNYYSHARTLSVFWLSIQDLTALFLSAGTHTDERPYQCNVCHMSFRWQSSFKAHEKSHERRNRGGRIAATSDVHSASIQSPRLPSVQSLLRPEVDNCLALPGMGPSSSRVNTSGAGRSAASSVRIPPPPPPIHPPPSVSQRSAPIISQPAQIASVHATSGRRIHYSAHTQTSSRRVGPHSTQTQNSNRRAHTRDDRGHRSLVKEDRGHRTRHWPHPSLVIHSGISCLAQRWIMPCSGSHSLRCISLQLNLTCWAS